jgi:hypothetical protein
VAALQGSARWGSAAPHALPRWADESQVLALILHLPLLVAKHLSGIRFIEQPWPIMEGQSDSLLSGKKRKTSSTNDTVTKRARRQQRLEFNNMSPQIQRESEQGTATTFKTSWTCRFSDMSRTTSALENWMPPSSIDEDPGIAPAVCALMDGSRGSPPQELQADPEELICYGLVSGVLANLRI